MKIIHFLLIPAALIGLVACKKNSVLPLPPLIGGFIPKHGGYGTNVTIKGMHFGDAGTEKIVKINGMTALITGSTDTSITVEVPLKAGDGKISVTTGGQTCESLDTFLYNYEAIVSTLAGNRNFGGYVDGQGKAARMSYVSGIAIDNQDNLYVADPGNNCIRKVTPQGLVSTFVGNPVKRGYADGAGNAVLFGDLFDIKYEKTEGAFYVIDGYNDTTRVRKITQAGQVSTFAGGGTNTAETVSNPLDAVLTFSYYSAFVNLAIDADKNLYVADKAGNYIRKINSNGISTLAGRRGGIAGNQDGQGANASFSAPSYLTPAVNGGLLLLDPGNHRIRTVTLSGQVSPFAGNGNNVLTDANTPLNASFTDQIKGIVQDSKGNAYIMDGFRLRMITAQGRVITLTDNSIGYADGNGRQAKFSYIWDIAVDSHDNLFITDSDNQCIRKVVIQ